MKNEVLVGLADEIGNLGQYVGGDRYAHLLLGPLENLAAVEETLVRDKVRFTGNLMPNPSRDSISRGVCRRPNPSIESVVSFRRLRSKNFTCPSFGGYRPETGSPLVPLRPPCMPPPTPNPLPPPKKTCDERLPPSVPMTRPW